MQKLFAQELRFNFTDEWEKYLLGDISLIGKGFTPSTSNPSFWDGDLKWLSIADMNQGKYINQTTKKITSDGSKNKEPVKKSTLLMSFKLSIGKLGILTEDMYTNEAICNFKWKNKDVLTEYMYYYLSSINILKYGSQAAKGITLNNETLSTIPVLLPSLEEQKKIINILSDVDMKINMLENSINDTSKFKKGLLQQMFVVRINWRCNFKLAKSPSFNKHLLILKNKIIFIIIELIIGDLFMKIEKDAENILNKFSKTLENIPDLEETWYITDNLNLTREDKSHEKHPEKILRNAHIDKEGKLVVKRADWVN